MAADNVTACGFCGVHYAIHPRYRSIAKLAEAREAHWDSHAWTDVETVRAIVHAAASGWRIGEAE